MSDHSGLNGGHYKKLEIIEQDVKDIKEDLSTAVNGLTHAIDKLTSKFDIFMHVAQNAIPVKAVFWIITIMILGLVGIEGSKSIAPILKFWLTATP